MNPDAKPSRKDRILGGLWGALIGDALGVPVEFKSRAEVQAHPVTAMRSGGTYGQQAGTWSDDGALLLCTVDSLLNHEFDTTDIGRRFLAWYESGLWTARGDVFDVGLTTTDALLRIRYGVPAEQAGGTDERSNGNGSLMRILPVGLRFAELGSEQMLERVHRASGITHGHARSRMACGLYCLVVRELLKGAGPGEAFAGALQEFRAGYEASDSWARELRCFELLLAGDLAARPESEIDSGGYVVHTLTASLWCLLTSGNFHDCVLKAVNLGGDTDTTGCVAGGLAGVAYGIAAVPQEWVQQLARQPEVADLFERFAELK